MNDHNLDSSQNDNDLTLQSYQDRTEEYVGGTPPVDDALKTWIDACLNLIPKTGKILEMGSGFGRDAEYIKERGYEIECTDAVLLHFTPQEAAQVTKKIYGALNDAGIFALRLKKGDGAVWTDAKLGAPRYFYYWQPEKLQEMLADCGFEWLGVTENHTNHNNADWIGIIARKIA